MVGKGNDGGSVVRGSGDSGRLTGWEQEKIGGGPARSMLVDSVGRFSGIR